MKSLISKIKKLFFKNNPLDIDFESITVPGALGIPEQVFDTLVNEMVLIIGEQNRLLDFKNYIESPMFGKHRFNLSNPNHLLILGYAFSAAIFIRRHMQQVSAANKLLEELSGVPQKDPDKIN